MLPLQSHSVKKGVRFGLGTALAAASLALTAPVLADAVTDWSAFADMVPMGAPPQQARIKAMMYVAMHDALNSIERRYESYNELPTAAEGSLPAAAVGQAAYRVLTDQVPAQAGVIAPYYNDWFAALPGCPSTACDQGIAVGDVAANAILERRLGDGSATPHLPYTLPAAPGVYQPTPPALAAPQFAGWANLTPFVLKKGSQFRAEPSLIFNLKTLAYTRDYLEVKRVGEANAEVNGDRTAEQSAIARFWPGGGANHNAVARLVVADRSLDLWQHARLFALLNMAVSDSAVTVFDTKFTYNFWRPVTAIRAADTDGNRFTVADAEWLSYQPTPPYPDYTCGLTNNTGAAFAVLRGYFGTDHIGYTQTAAGITRSFTSLSQAGFESVDARVFGGMHFRTGCVRGLIQGGQVGRYALQHALEPLRNHRR
jgi:hypothetical protein